MAQTINDREPIVGINVTPFVDVVLVLLVIFMATSSYMVDPAIEVELPEAASGTDVVETTLALVLSEDGRLFLNGVESTSERVAAFCRYQSSKTPDLQAIIAADGRARHSQVVSLIDLVKLNGVHSFALNIQEPNATGQR
jgi:biopolymer transport protein ExbD